MASFTLTVPDSLVPKLQRAFTEFDETLATPAQTKERVIKLIKDTIRHRLQDVDNREFRATQEQYNDIAGE